MRMEAIRPVDAGTLLVRALRRSADVAGCSIHVETLAARPWSSATFTGTRVRVTLRAAAGAALDAWLTALPEAELGLRGHLVADLAVDADPIVGDARRATLTALILVEG